jgi:hypothetical protein
MNDYLLSIGLTEDNKIKYFDLYDPIKLTQYNGAFKIKDRFFKTKKDDFIKYQKEWNHIIIPIDRKYFNFFLESDYDNLREITLNQFVIKYGLEEHLI